MLSSPLLLLISVHASVLSYLYSKSWPSEAIKSFEAGRGLPLPNGNRGRTRPEGLDMQKESFSCQLESEKIQNIAYLEHCIIVLHSIHPRYPCTPAAMQQDLSSNPFAGSLGRKRDAEESGMNDVSTPAAAFACTSGTLHAVMPLPKRRTVSLDDGFPCCLGYCSSRLTRKML